MAVRLSDLNRRDREKREREMRERARKLGIHVVGETPATASAAPVDGPPALSAGNAGVSSTTFDPIPPSAVPQAALIEFEGPEAA